jgi:hypothetical protein
MAELESIGGIPARTWPMNIDLSEAVVEQALNNSNKIDSKKRFCILKLHLN